MILFKHLHIVIYQGPYEDVVRKGLNRMYDFLFLRSIRKRIALALAKSRLAKGYLGERVKEVYDEVYKDKE
jgi:hypothetical protein